ncbi:MAG TPA: T9SS type A sorting domain-containing protein [Candidatus Deferrimicrobium sp.]|nr:T9SS type A sorting domain-containing protein [Candidatus Deferrimicrobium sp.]
MKARLSLLALIAAGLAILCQPVIARDMSSLPVGAAKDCATAFQPGGSDTIIDPLINWPTWCGVQRTGEIDASFNCFGQFGQGFVSCYEEGWPNASFGSPSGGYAEYLFGGAIWVGGIVNGDTFVTTGTDGWSRSGQELCPPEFLLRGTVAKFQYPADFSMRAEFLDTTIVNVDVDYFGRDHVPLNIRVANRSHVWRTDPYRWTVIYDMVITNIGGGPIEKGYVGLFFVADAGATFFDQWWRDDVAGSLRDPGIGYVSDDDGDPYAAMGLVANRIFAFKFLTSSHPLPDSSFNWWMSNGSPVLDFGPRRRPQPDDPWRDFGTGGIGTPEGDVNKYYVMRHKEWDYDQIRTANIDSTDSIWMFPTADSFPQELLEDIADGIDARFLMSIGPFDLLPNSSVRVLYATFTGDSVHTDPNNVNNLPDNPDLYLANLDFTYVLENAAWSDSLAQILLNPELPVTGLQVEYTDNDSVVVRWDPWVYDDVTGYEIYLWTVPPESLPHAGVVPPWLKPEELDLQASVNRTHQYTFDALSPDSFYLVNVAHRTTAGPVGEPGPSLPIWLGERPQGPEFEKEYVYSIGGAPIELDWSPPEKANVDYYIIYRFLNADSALSKYHAFYDEGYQAQFRAPKDSILVDGQRYYFYAMEPYVQVPGNQTSFTITDVVEGTVYVATAVDNKGFESEFSIDVTTLVIEEPTKDILLITCRPIGSPWFFMRADSLMAYYDWILSGYDYDVYVYNDSLHYSRCPTYEPECVDWHDFVRYRWVIVDGNIFEGDALTPISEFYEGRTKGISKHILAGRKLIYFGSFDALLNLDPATLPGTYAASESFIHRFFGIDSICYVGACYFFCQHFPIVDTFFAFCRADSVTEMYPSLMYDTTRYPFTTITKSFWPTNTAPSVSTFKVNSRGETTHLFRALPGINSMNEGQPVGVKTSVYGTETYLFGFHLWYMDYEGGRRLIQSIVGSPTGAGDPDDPQLPDRFSVAQNYPNPFNPTTTIEYSLPTRSQVTITIYNILGQVVTTLVNTQQPAGTHRVTWEGRDSNNRPVATGLYFYRIKTGEHVATRKMLLLK